MAIFILTRNFRLLWFFVNNHSVYIRIKTIRYSGPGSSALESRNRNNNKMEKRKLTVTLKVLDKVKVQFSQTKKFIEERLEQECLKENISVEEVIFVFRSLELAQKNIFYFVMLGFKAETFWLKLYLAKYVKIYSIKLKLARLWYLLACYLDLV